MVSSKHKEVLWVFNFISQHETDRFDGLFSTIDVITEEKVVGLSRIPSIFEELNQVRKLPMNVPWIRLKVPQILIGAYNSNSIGCSKKIYLDF